MKVLVIVDFQIYVPTYIYIKRSVSFFSNFLFLSDEGPMLETLDYTIRIGSTPTFFYFDLYLNTAYAAHYVYYIDINIRHDYNLFYSLGLSKIAC